MSRRRARPLPQAAPALRATCCFAPTLRATCCFAPTLRAGAAVSLAVAALVVLPLFFALLAPPTLTSGEGASLSAASRDLSTAALDRLERLLSGELTVRLAGLDAVAAHATLLHVSTRALGYRAPLSDQRSRPSETERTL